MTGGAAGDTTGEGADPVAEATAAAPADDAAPDATRVLCIERLEVTIAATGARILEGISLQIRAGEVLALVGESGSGKTTAGLAALGHFRRGTRAAGGRVLVGANGAAVDVLAARGSRLRELRGGTVAYVPQDPADSLNSALRVGTQIREVLDAHNFESGGRRDDRVAEVLREVGLPDDKHFQRRYPHQLSGGQQQRVGIAMAFACRPAVIVLDEPTTGLDVTTQAKVLDTVRSLTREHRVAALYITHDLAVVSAIADRVTVMYAGNLVEIGPAGELLAAPAHPYTQRLVAAAPDIEGRRVLRGMPGQAPSPADRPAGCHFAPRCRYAAPQCLAAFPEFEPAGVEHQVRCVRHAELGELGAEDEGTRAAPRPKEDALLALRDLQVSFDRHQVLDRIDLDLHAGECVVLLGESGSGKTTISRCVAGLHDRYTGSITFDGQRLARGARGRTREQRRRVQYVFQSPYSSLNPRHTVTESLALPLRALTDEPSAGHRGLIDEMLERVALRAELADRYPDQLSGGERQRVAIARALIGRPDVLICDEVTSALDVSVQASIVDLLRNLQIDMGLTMLFVTHNIALVRHVAQRVAVLKDGRIVEIRPADELIDSPADPYTRELISDTPSL